ncbi:restriction endonuclease subunit S [Stutzerimonas nitrititolerans]|uniref:restriction endonuclease subunit S n=1 Tax=Stutzerimonas nitrititolerans TaxID=2482751 RepID=UPI00289D48AF|nr:restriction endonuclease subunit S [Stutzerimonas nitrititolerans]
MTFTTYPAYKDSGVEWLGKTPEHWKVVPAKRGISVLTDFTANGSFAALAENVEYQSSGYARLIRMTDLRQNLETDGIWIDESAYKYLEKSSLVGGELLMASVGSVGLIYLMPEVDYPASLAPNMYLLKTNSSLLSKFLYWSLLSEGGQSQIFQVATTTAQPKLNKDNVRSIVIALPEVQEQIQIARFLDHETARIDALIEEQQRLIELLKEKRQAVISHAVTKGLDPTVPMKDSGVEWLGEVPAHWIISQLKFNTTEMQTGPFGSQLHAEDYVDGGIPLINPAHMVDGRIIPDFQVSVDEETWSRLSRHALKAGEIIFARRGELGRCAVVSKDQEGWLCGTGSLKASLNSRLSSEYAYLLVTSKGVVSELSLESKGSTMENLNTETLGRVRLPLPPLSEQEAILEHVHEIAGQFAALMNEAEDGIKLITERRSALISAAVTGKIDVRGWQPPASSQAVEPAVAEAV